LETSENIHQLLIKWEAVPELSERKKIKQQLVEFINHLLIHDFHKLILVLYRVDVNENKLKQLLADHPSTDAAELIAGLLIKRTEEKARSKASYKPGKPVDDEEKW
jgi:hypothetical protein